MKKEERAAQEQPDPQPEAPDKVAKTQDSAPETASAPEKTTASRSAPAKGILSIQSALLVLAVIYTLALGRGFFIPVALAFLISLVVAPVVLWLERRHIPRAVGGGMVVFFLVALLGYGLTFAVAPIDDWVERAPRVLQQLERELYPIKEAIQQVSRTAEKVDSIASVDGEQGAQNTAPQASGPRVRDIVYANARSLIVGLVMVTFLLYFFLAWGRAAVDGMGELIEDERKRRNFLELSTLLEIEVSRYLFTITLINFMLALAVAGALYLLGMPNPLLWGALAGLLNFMPYLGSVVTAILLSGVALLTFDGLVQPMTVLAVFVTLTVLEGQFITPLVLGRRLALNPLVVFLSVAFWFWLWGVMGALMAVPILITLKIIGDRVDAMRPIAKLAGR